MLVLKCTYDQMLVSRATLPISVSFTSETTPNGKKIVLFNIKLDGKSTGIPSNKIEQLLNIAKNWFTGIELKSLTIK